MGLSRTYDCWRCQTMDFAPFPDGGGGGGGGVSGGGGDNGDHPTTWNYTYTMEIKGRVHAVPCTITPMTTYGVGEAPSMDTVVVKEGHDDVEVDEDHSPRFQHQRQHQQHQQRNGHGKYGGIASYSAPPSPSPSPSPLPSPSPPPSAYHYRVAYELDGIVSGADEWTVLAVSADARYVLVYYCGRSDMSFGVDYQGAIVMAREPRLPSTLLSPQQPTQHAPGQAPPPPPASGGRLPADVWAHFNRAFHDHRLAPPLHLDQFCRNQNNQCAIVGGGSSSASGSPSTAASTSSSSPAASPASSTSCDRRS